MAGKKSSKLLRSLLWHLKRLLLTRARAVSTAGCQWAHFFLFLAVSTVIRPLLPSASAALHRNTFPKTPVCGALRPSSAGCYRRRWLQSPPSVHTRKSYTCAGARRFDRCANACSLHPPSAAVAGDPAHGFGAGVERKSHPKPAVLRHLPPTKITFEALLMLLSFKLCALWPRFQSDAP